MLVHDLTHTITEDILVWPGTEQPKLSEGSTFERDGFRETRLEIFSHVGTHMDAPAHMRVDRPQLDELPASAFCGTAWVLDARGCAPGGEVPAEAVEGAALSFCRAARAWKRISCSSARAGTASGTRRSISGASPCSPRPPCAARWSSASRASASTRWA